MRNSPTTTKSCQTKSRPTRQLACIISSMSKPHRKTSSLPPDDTLYAVKQRTPVPHEFVLDTIAPLSPRTRSMFGCLAIYVEDKIVFILRDKRDQTADTGVWLATTEEHHQSLRREFPNMRSIQVLGKKVTGWQVRPMRRISRRRRCAPANSFSHGTLESGRCRGSGPDRRLRRQRKSRSTQKRQRRPQKVALGREQSPILIAVQRCDIVRHRDC